MSEKPTFEPPQFDPKRSDAIRTMLLETVAEGRPRRFRLFRPNRNKTVSLVVLVALAVGLGGGAAAWAITGRLPFTSVAEPTPAATTPTSTHSASPAPKATLSPTLQKVTVSNDPITPHDVDALPASPSWQLDLPGEASGACLIHTVYGVADGFALFQVGPKAPDDGGFSEGCDFSEQNESLTLIDTRTGDQRWTRSWSWADDRGATSQTILLGTSGRVLVDASSRGTGPHEVLDLQTGQAVSEFAPEQNTGEYLGFQPILDDSGDLIVTRQGVDAQGNRLPSSQVSRIDPMDAAHPKWSTHIDGSGPSVPSLGPDQQLVPLTYYTGKDSSYTGGFVDIDTGAFTAQAPGDRYEFFTGFGIRESNFDSNGRPQKLIGLDGNGDHSWTRTVPAGSYIVEVGSIGALPGLPTAYPLTGNGQFLIQSGKKLTLVDGQSGEAMWSTDASGCTLVTGDYPGYRAIDNPAGGQVMLTDNSDTSCAFDAADGARVGSFDSPLPFQSLLGSANVYNSFTTDDTVVAHDMTTGKLLWTVPHVSQDLWFFAGGYLVRMNGNHVTSVG